MSIGKYQQNGYLFRVNNPHQRPEMTLYPPLVLLFSTKTDNSTPLKNKWQANIKFYFSSYNTKNTSECACNQNKSNSPLCIELVSTEAFVTEW